MQAQRGFGLVEMMVSLALGLVVVGGATMLFTATRQASVSTENLSRIQESVRTSYDLMAREVREAGGTPCDARLVVTNVLNNAQGVTPTWWAIWDEPVRGFDGGTAFGGAPFGTAVGERVAGTQALTVRYGQPVDGLAVASHTTATATVATNRTNNGIAAGDLLMLCNYGQGAIVQAATANAAAGTFTHTASAGSPGNCTAGLGVPLNCAAGASYEFVAGSLVGRFVAAGWYIGNNGRSATGGRSLYRVTRDGAEEVADGMRDMQLSYLQVGNADYVAAAAVTNWSLVTAVRFDLVFEGPDTGAATTSPTARLQRPVSFTVNLRNQQS